MNWLNLGLVYFIILLTVNSLMIIGEFPGLNTTTQGNLLACLPTEVRSDTNVGSGSVCDVSSASTEINVSSVDTDQIPTSVGLIDSLISVVSSVASGIVGGAANIALQIVPGTKVLANFIGNLLFGYLSFFAWIGSKFAALKFISLIIGGILFVIQVLAGFYFILTILSAFTGGAVK